jgi:penicillin-binding protein 2
MHTLSSVKSQSWLAWFLRGIIILCFLVLATRLFEIQIIKGDYFRALSEENRIRHVPIPAPRGKILAVNGEVLVGNKEIKKRIKFNEKGMPELSEDLSGASPEEIIVDFQRYYPLGEKFAHASGYIGAPSEDQVGKIDPNCPEKGPVPSDSLVGKNGLELFYDCLLGGISGEELVEVDTRGARVRSLGRKEPTPGRDIRLFIDIDLQNEVARNMQDKKGAAVVTTPDGKVLAFYSNPSFDPNLFMVKNDNEKISQLFNDPNLPFFNRVTGGTFHPGSVYKPLTSLAALEENAIDQTYTYTDTGSIVVNEFTYNNWYFTEYGRTEGTIDLPKAIARSTDTFFYKIGELTGAEKIALWSEKFGLDARTGIDIKGEVAGLIPSPAWKKKVKKENWFLGNTYHMSIGQGDVALTPMEVNNFIAAIAADGRICEPRFFSGNPSKCRTIEVKKENLEYVVSGMRDACTEGGTAYTFFDFTKTHGGNEIACKTGTAEVGTDGEPHAWFTAFGPMSNPQIVTTVLVEKGGQGSQVAGPVVRSIMDYYFAGAKTE